ncbi:serine/threonine protein kinase [Pendulispora rubella]|uniref:Serine/threonine protein kinase n=1 Tax=Pendulispora rubella TaxID=2741070 RepID=A0ABZ2L7Y0_9BACT
MFKAVGRSECLDENELLAFFDAAAKGRPDAKRHAHLDVCAECRLLVAEFARSAADDSIPVVDELAPAFDGRPRWRGSLVGRYRLERFIGEGGLGFVWAASDAQGHEAFALKFLKPCEPDLARRLLREGRVTAALSHPNIVRVHEVFEAPGFPPAIVMDLLDGESLGARLRREGALPLGVTAAMLLAIAEALRAAHARGVVHRDLKPDNVFLTGASVKVLDFGFAKLTAMEGGFAATDRLTRTGQAVGTPSYMAPEQIFAEATVDARADVWSLGVMAFECLAGRKPIESRSMGPLLQAIAKGDLPRLDTHVAGLPSAVTDLVSRMLSTERSKRPSLEEIARALAPFASPDGGK